MRSRAQIRLMGSMLKILPGALLFAGALLPGTSPAQATLHHSGKTGTPGCGPRVRVEYTDDNPDYFIIKNRSPKGWTLGMWRES